MLARLAPYESAAAPAAETEAKEKERNGSVTVEALLNLIKSRRSVFPKDYNGKPVPSDIVDQMLEAANWAPTHGKTEPWRFVVMSDSATIQRFQRILATEMLQNVQQGSEAHSSLLKKLARKEKEKKNCSHLIAICKKKVLSSKGKYMPDWEDTSAVAIAVQNMHLIAHAAGLAGYWSTGGVASALSSSSIATFLDLPEGESCLGLFHLGMSDKISKYRGSRKPWQEKVRYVKAGSDSKE